MGFKKWKDQNWFPYTVAACSAVILFVILTHLDMIGGFFLQFCGYFSPVILGLVIAYVLDPLVVFLQKRLGKVCKKETVTRSIAVVLTILLVVFLMGEILSSLIPQLISSVFTFLDNFQEYAKHIQKFQNDINTRFPMVHLDLSGILRSSTRFLDQITEELPEHLNKIANASSAVGGRVMNWVMGIILAIYLLADKRRLLTTVKFLLGLLLSRRKYKTFSQFWKRCNTIMIKYIVCELLEGFAIGGLNFLFMLIMRMPYAVLVSVVIGISNMIPTFGPIIGAVIGGLILLLANPWHALAFLIFTILLQIVDGYILKPKMYGETLGVPSVLILASIIVGGKIFSVVGILLAIPFAAIISFLYEEALIPWLEVQSKQREQREQTRQKNQTRNQKKHL